MREIVFRAKSIEGEWVYGGGVVYTEGSGYILVGNDYDRISSGIYELHRAAHIVAPDTVGEWTGLVDKYGTKVFEGDIIGRRRDRRDRPAETVYEGVVRYGEFNCSCCDGVYGWYLDDYGDIRDFGAETNKVVIGNIHDNPELIKGGENDD